MPMVAKVHRNRSFTLLLSSEVIANPERPQRRKRNRSDRCRSRVLAGFIVGFPSFFPPTQPPSQAPEREFIELTHTSVGDGGALQALPTYRALSTMKCVRRLPPRRSEALTYFSPPNFYSCSSWCRSVARPQPLAGLYEASLRARSVHVEVGSPGPRRFPPHCHGVQPCAGHPPCWPEGMRSPYKREYWKFLDQLVLIRVPAGKLWLGSMVSVITSSSSAPSCFEQESLAFEKSRPPPPTNPRHRRALKLAARA